LNNFITENGLKSFKTNATSGVGIQEGFMHIAREEALNYDEDEEVERQKIDAEIENEVPEEPTQFYDPVIEILEDLAN